MMQSIASEAAPLVRSATYIASIAAAFVSGWVVGRIFKWNAMELGHVYDDGVCLRCGLTEDEVQDDRVCL